MSARTILHLGQDLISSDFVAVYELIKNGIDTTRDRAVSDAKAGLESIENERSFVDLDVLIRIPHAEYRQFAKSIEAQMEPKRKKKVPRLDVDLVRQQICAALVEGAPRNAEFRKELAAAETWAELGAALDGANVLTVQDWGKGMSLEDLEKIYLLIGTPNRDAARTKKSTGGDGESSDEIDQPIFLGEKGIGRLSAMRLGHRLDLCSARREDESWNRLTVDWRIFAADAGDLLEDIEVGLSKVEAKARPDDRGTRVHITALRSEWSRRRLHDLARDQFSRLTDPFTPEDRYPIRLRYNGNPEPIPAFEELLFDNAHAILEAEFSPDEPRLTGRLNYTYRNKERSLQLCSEDLSSAAGKALPMTLLFLGPFELKIYWYNRQALRAIDGIGDKEAVRKLVNSWSGGVMLFRDGFRVMPYGSSEDDWLKLDRKALSSGSYRVNRHQIIGRVHITRKHNSMLVDQTNREGLRDNDTKRVFVNLLRFILIEEFRTFIGKADEEAKEFELQGIPKITKRWSESQKKFRKSMALLRDRFPAVKNDREIYGGLMKAAQDIDRSIKHLKLEEDVYQNRVAKLVNLAGLGLMVEIVAHELNRATEVAVGQLDGLAQHELPSHTSGALLGLKAQLNTLVKRLAILDPMSTARRQRKTPFDVVVLTRAALAFHQAKFDRHHIAAELRVQPEGWDKSLEIKVVEGQISMVIQNLLDNSIYWLKERRRIDNSFEPKITVTVDKKKKEIRVTDNGPGVAPDIRERIFDPFFSRKPPGERKGLGLYISREIAGYHRMSLDLVDSPEDQGGNLHTFVFSLKERR